MKRIDLRKAFTMIELIFIIIIVGILALVATPRLNDNNLRLAADQLMSHIRYTQHLAMQADKFDPNDANWFKKRWQLKFSNRKETEYEEAYTIFEDTVLGKPGAGSTGSPEKSEIAKNPLKPEKLLTGGTNSIYTTDKIVTSELNIGKKYGVKKVEFSSSCRVGNSRRIAFDYLGRPLKGDLSTYTTSYPEDRLISEPCKIKLEDGDGNSITITVEPETGFVETGN